MPTVPDEWLELTPDGMRAFRKSLDLSQPDFGEMFGIGGQTVKTWEHGWRKIPDTVKILIGLFQSHASVRRTLTGRAEKRAA